MWKVCQQRYNDLIRDDRPSTSAVLDFPLRSWEATSWRSEKQEKNSSSTSSMQQCCLAAIWYTVALVAAVVVAIRPAGLNMAISEHGALQPHVVLVPSPLKGHTIPFIILTKQLVGHGVWVTLVSSDKHIASQEQDKVNFVGLREGPSNFMEAISEVSDVRMAEMLSGWEWRWRCLKN